MFDERLHNGDTNCCPYQLSGNNVDRKEDKIRILSVGYFVRCDALRFCVVADMQNYYLVYLLRIELDDSDASRQWLEEKIWFFFFFLIRWCFELGNH